MSRTTRRTFLKNTLAAAATITIAGTKSTGRVLGANDTIRIGVAGLNGRGKEHVNQFGKMKGVQITYLIDPDTRTFGPRLEQLQKLGGSPPKTVQDIRQALEDKQLDAVSVATPNHWHALITIWACQAGKDVYVEKPCSHNVHEGRIAVETARKYDRIVQHGTQSRSSKRWAEVAAVIQSGKLGKLLVSRGLCYKPRLSIGIKEDSPTPAEVDFNLWLGPATERPFNRNLVHYNWHWFWDFGNGDIGNQGVHQMDLARWMIPQAVWPRSVFSLGGRFGYKDQGQTANTQMAVFDYGQTLLIFEVRGLYTPKFHGQGAGNICHLEEGIIAGTDFYPRGSDKPAPLPKVDTEATRGPGGGHFQNFIAAVRSRQTSDLNADILEGHQSSALIHLANASYRLGADLPFNRPQSRNVGDNNDVQETIGRMTDHLRSNGVKLEETSYRLGRKLIIDQKTGAVQGEPAAEQLLTRVYRKPFVVPEKVS